MAYDPNTGMWKPDANSSTADNVTKLTATDSPFMAQAKARGIDTANQRGLLNSSIAAGASQKAAYDAALPIAKADANISAQKDISAQQFAQNKDLQTQQIASTEKIAGEQKDTQLAVADMNVRSNAQDKSAAAAQNYASIYGSMVNNINANKDIPAASRAKYLADAKTFYDNSMRLVEQTYNVQLDWGGGGGSTANGASLGSSVYDQLNQAMRGF